MELRTKQKLRAKIRTNRDLALKEYFEKKTDWNKISKLALKNAEIEKQLKED